VITVPPKNFETLKIIRESWTGVQFAVIAPTSPLSSVYEEDSKGACGLGLDIRRYLTDDYRKIVETFFDDVGVRGALGRMSVVEDGGNALARAFYLGLDFVER